MIAKLYCQVDDFNIKNAEESKRQLIANGQKHQREGKLSLSEIMTILNGFKLHMVINHLGEMTALKLIVGDKGYLSKTLQHSLETQGVNLITKIRKNMKQPDYSDFELALLNKRALIETVFDQLKNLFQIEHSRHRSLNGQL